MPILEVQKSDFMKIRGPVGTVQKNSVFLLDRASSSGYTRFNSLAIIDALRLSMGWRNSWWYPEGSIGVSAAPAERVFDRLGARVPDSHRLGMPLSSTKSYTRSPIICLSTQTACFYSLGSALIKGDKFHAPHLVILFSQRRHRKLAIDIACAPCGSRLSPD